MYVRFPKYVASALFLILATAACGRTPSTPTSPVPAAGPPLSITAEPAIVRPEVIPGLACAGRSAFGLRLTIVLRGRSDLILRDVRFELLDGLGGRTLPAVNTFPEPGVTSIPTSSPVPVPVPGTAALPGAGPVTIPGLPSTHGLFVPAETSRPFQFFLAFDCRTLPEGTLLVVVDTIGPNGASTTSQLRLGVRS